MSYFKFIYVNLVIKMHLRFVLIDQNQFCIFWLKCLYQTSHHKSVALKFIWSCAICPKLGTFPYKLMAANVAQRMGLHPIYRVGRRSAVLAHTPVRGAERCAIPTYNHISRWPCANIRKAKLPDQSDRSWNKNLIHSMPIIRRVYYIQNSYENSVGLKRGLNLRLVYKVLK